MVALITTDWEYVFRHAKHADRLLSFAGQKTSVLEVIGVPMDELFAV
jgi:hypothetical protein